jgi:FKBP-type peptidyl-prolyl cis-trans isomerase FkpA
MTEPCSNISTHAGFSRRRSRGSFGMVGTAILSATALAACGTDSPTRVCEEIEASVEDATYAPELNVTVSNLTALIGVYIEDRVIGTGPVAEAGDVVDMKYTGWLVDGTQFDASNSFPFILGLSNVIIGWHAGIEGMQAGGTRLLVIPPSSAYGLCSTGAAIPANSILVFEVEMNSLTPSS